MKKIREPRIYVTYIYEVEVEGEKREFSFNFEGPSSIEKREAALEALKKKLAGKKYKIVNYRISTSIEDYL